MIVHWPRETGDDARLGVRESLDYAQAYKHICSMTRRRVLGGGNDPDTGTPPAIGGATVLIVTTPHVDSLAATRILTQLLVHDEVPFRLVPVNGYRALRRILAQDVHEHHELHTLIFVNLGSLLSLPQMMPLPPHCTLHVIDSHRPWNLTNLFATSRLNDQIWIWDDGEIAQRLGKEREAFEMLEFDYESDSESESGLEQELEPELEFDSEAESRPDSRGHHPDTNPEPSTSEDHTILMEASRKRSHSPSRKERSSKRTRLDASQRQIYRAILAKYYARGSSIGMSTAQMMYMLAVSLGRSDRDSLWYAILGLTSQYTSNAIHATTYDGYAAALASDVVAMNAVSDQDTPSTLPGVNVHGADDSSIRVLPEELRFTLYRHWSLEMSMYHTSYVAAKLGIWREKGIHKLRGLLAKMGLSLANCRQTYEHMELDLRESLVQRMESIAPEYGLVDLTFRSFLRAYGFRSMPISACDAVEGIAALLQAAHGVRIEIDGVHIVRSESTVHGGTLPMDRAVSSYGGRTLWVLNDDEGLHIPALSRGNSQTPGSLDSSTSGLQPIHANEPQAMAHAPSSSFAYENKEIDSDTSAVWVKNFFEAYRAMDAYRPQNVALLQASLQLAKSLHQAIVAQGVSIIVKQSIKTLRSFRLTILQEGPSLHLFVQPDTLTRLGYWLIDALRDIVSEQHAKRMEARRERRRRKGSSGDDTLDSLSSALTTLPFVLAALDASRDVFVVVGIVGAAEYGDVAKNQFGLAFQDAAELSGARMRNDLFESSVLEVRRADLMPFVEALHLKA